MGYRASEPVGVADNPIGHEPSVRAACNPNTASINLRIFFEYQIGELHQVLIVDGTVFAPYIGKFIPSSVAASRIAEEHKIAFVCPKLHFMIKDFTIYRLRPAVYIKNPGVALAFIVIGRLQDKAFQRYAVIFKLQPFRPDDDFVLHCFFIEIRFLNFDSILTGIYFLKLRSAQSYEHYVSVAYVKTVHRAVVFRQLLYLPIQGKLFNE